MLWGGVQILRPVNYALYFGRYVEEKGVKTLCEAAKQNRTIRFLLAGKGPLSQDIEDGQNLINTGFKTSEQIKELILNSSFCICPSECYETFGLSVGEALVLGKKVIASDLGGISEQINNGENGIIFECGNANDLSVKIQELWGCGRKQTTESINYGKKGVENYYEQIKGIYSK